MKTPEQRVTEAIAGLPTNMLLGDIIAAWQKTLAECENDLRDEIARATDKVLDKSRTEILRTISPYY